MDPVDQALRDATMNQTRIQGQTNDPAQRARAKAAVDAATQRVVDRDKAKNAPAAAAPASGGSMFGGLFGITKGKP